jgi:hypothetical protein
MAYVKPDQLSADASWFGNGPYSKPLSSAADAAWATPAPGEMLHVGFDGAEFGSHEIFNAQLVAAPSGIAAPTSASPSVRNATSVLKPPGLSAPTFSSQKIQNRTNYIVGAAGNQAKFGTQKLQNGTGYITAGAGAQTGYGSHRVESATRYIVASAGTQTLYGTTKLNNLRQYLKPAGYPALSFGSTSVENLLRFFDFAPVRRRHAFGAETEVYNLKQISEFKLGNTLRTGNPTILGGIQYFYAKKIPIPTAGNKSWVSHSPRFIAPKSIQWSFYTKPTMSYTLSVSPQGFDAAKFGERIVPEEQRFETASVGKLRFGDDALVQLKRRRIYPTGFKSHAAEDLRFGTGEVWNWVSYYEFSTRLKESFGAWVKVENRTKEVRHHSTNPGMFYGPVVLLKARQLRPAGIQSGDPGPFYKSGEVSHRHRSLPVDGVVPPEPSRWSKVRNNARLITSVGSTSDVFGTPDAWNNRRYLIKIGDVDAAKFGTAFVSDGVRTIEFDTRYGIAPPPIRMPEVFLRTRYLDRAGNFDAFKTGGHALHIHWSIAYPKWTHKDEVLTGVPGIRNVTPMLGQRGHDSAEFGDTGLRTQWRNVTPRELFAQVFGQTKVADRRQRIDPVAIGAFRMSDKMSVAKLQPDPPAKQWITIQPGQAHGYGPMQTYNDGSSFYPPQPTSDHGFGTAVMNAILIYPKGIDQPMPQFGQPSLIYMGINDVTVSRAVEHPGKPTVTYRNRRVVVERPPNYSGPPFGEHDAYGKPQLNPLTIWAVMDAPQQARDNHPYVDRHYVDYVPGFNGYWMKGMGKPSISMLNRRVNASGQIATSYGVATVKNKTTFVSVVGERYSFVGKPKLLGFLRYITPSNNNAPGYVEHEFGGALGLATISNSTRTVSPVGIASTNRLDKPVVDHFHRFIKPAGMDTCTVSSHSGYQYPYQWQKIRVGPLMPTIPSGKDMAVFGTPWASNRVRGVDPDGFDAFAIGETFEEFDFRMRVKRVPEETRPFRLLRPATFGGNMVPHPYVRPAAHHILPDGNMDNFRKGGT